MKKIQKSLPKPQALTDYLHQYEHAPTQWTWVKFKKNNARRDAVKQHLHRDQRGICAYCEINLIHHDETVEHFTPRWTANSAELDWDNLLLCCCGGEKPLPEDVEDAAFRYDPNSCKTCGHAKLGNNTTIVSPLQIPAFPRLFRFKSETGEIYPDDANCGACNIAPSVVEQTIQTLGLRATRLNRARLMIITTMLELLEDQGSSKAFSIQLAKELARQQIPATGDLPAFFTTIRWALSAGAEAHLNDIHFNG